MKILCSTQMGSGTILGQTMRVVAIAKALQRKGHQIQFLAGEKLLPVLKDSQFELIPLPEMPELSFQGNLTKMEEPSQREEFAATIKKIFELLMKAEKEAVAAEKPDLMLCGTLTGPLTAHSCGIPCVLTFLQPHGKKTFSHFLQRMSDDEGLKNHFSGVMSIFTPEMTGGGDFGQLIIRTLDAVTLIFLEGMPEIAGDTDFTALGDWYEKIKDKLRYTGPLLAESPEQLPEQAVLKQKYTGAPDKPLIYVTIGGGSTLIGEDFLSIVLDMFRELPEVQGFISTGLAIPAEKLAGYHPPDNVLIRGFVPGTELIKAGNLTVFHGGSSTLMNCIACGRPAVVIPSIGEQEDNGAVLAEHGAGIILDKNNLTAAVLRDAVQQILNNSSFRDHARELKELAEKYGGAEGAAKMIEEAINGRVLTGAGTYSRSR